MISKLSVILIVCQLSVILSDDYKSSLVFVIDDTGSMGDDIVEVKRRTNDIFDAVLKSEESQIENFILVTFNDPLVKVRTSTRDSDVFKSELAKINVYGGVDCPEYSMTGIERGLEKSLPGSYVYVFTDASAKDYRKHDQVKALALKKSVQVVFVLTGECNADLPQNREVYYTLAKATKGQVFHLGKDDVGDILNYVVESIKSRGTDIINTDFEPGLWHIFNYAVDFAIRELIISVAGSKPDLVVKNENGTEVKTENVVDKDNIKVVKVPNPDPGNYTAEVKTKSKGTIVVTGKTTLNFQHGFSTFKPTSFNDTVTRPPPDEASFLTIKLNIAKNESGIIKLIEVKILDMDKNVVNILPLEVLDDEQKLYITVPFLAPKTLFQIMVIGKNLINNMNITRISQVSIEPQDPTKEIKENKAPTIVIDGYPKTNAEYDEPLMLKCKVKAYPKPDIIWLNKNTEMPLPTTVSSVELPYDYIGILNIEKVNKNSTYECKATNDFGSDEKSIEIETKRKIYFIELAIPKDIEIEYEKEASILCKIDSNPPVSIIWYKNDVELSSSSDQTISDDGSELTISDMQPYYRGNYRCKAKNEFNEKFYDFKVTISGVEPPQIDKRENKINAARGTDVDILCSMIRGKPEPKINWYFKYNSENNFQKLKTTGIKLHFENIQDTKNGIYRCEAISVMGKDSHDIDLTIEYPPIIKDDIDVVSAKNGDLITMTCEVEGMPKPNVKWMRNDIPIVSTLETRIYRDHSLKFKVSMKDTGMYYCVAENYLGSANKTVSLYVYVPPTIKAPERYTIIAMVGEDVHLPCQAEGFPKPHIKWIHNDVDLKIPYKSDGSTDAALSLSHVQLSSEGDYTCIASNIAGSYNISYKLIVSAPPNIENIYPEKTFRAVEGDTVLSIACKATGSPKPAITWTKDGRNVAFGTKWYTTDESGSLIVMNVDKQSEGVYVCEATNIIGRDMELYTIQVDPYPQPGTPTSTITVEEGSSTDIDCNVPHGPLDYIRWYKGPKMVSNGKLKLTNTKLSDAGIYTCRVSTILGSWSGHISIKVGSKPKFTSNEAEYYDIEEGVPLYLICEATAVPPAEVTWWRDDKKIDETDMVYVFEMEFASRGKYDCEVTNEIGSIHRTFYVRSKDCLLDIKKYFTSNSPAVVPSRVRWPSFETIKGSVRIPRDSTITLVCPSVFTHFPKQTVDAFCNGGTNFLINGNTYDFADVKCTEQMKPKIQKTNKKCFGDDTELLQVGFELFKQFLPAYEVCFDHRNQVPVYTKHSLDLHLADVEPEVAYWMNSEMPYEFDEMYDCDNQTDFISESLQSWFHKEDLCCFKKRQLVSPKDITPGVAQMATYHYLNVVPHWSSCGTENWEEVENRLRRMVKETNYPLKIWTGTFKHLEMLSASSSSTNIWISDNSDRQQPVAQYLWKVIQDSVTKSSLAIIQVNVPDLLPSEANNYVFCKDICDEVPWLKHSEWHDVNKGYTFCCSLQDFIKIIKHQRIFDPGQNGVLYYMASLSKYSLT